MTDEAPYLVREGQLEQEAVKWLYYNLPENDWESCYLEFRKAGPIAEAVVKYTRPNGDVEPFSPPSKLIDSLMDLREFMATLGKGAWLSLRLELTKDAKYSFKYNYDERPNWLAPVDDEAYVVDLQKFPRPPEAIPAWYPRAN